ncbi:hypothetical protein JCM10207_000028 [Rhodosporidiobolus poonsookiae]
MQTLRRPFGEAQHPAAPALALSSDEDEGDAPPRPPEEYFALTRSLVPTSTRRDALVAWDSTSAVGAGRAPEGGRWSMDCTRVQAAIGALLDARPLSSPSSDALQPAAGPSNAGKRPRSPSPLPLPARKGLFRAPSSPVSGKEDEGTSGGEGRHVKRVREWAREGAGSNGKGKGKGKGKEKAVEVVISDDEDDEDREPDSEVEPDTEEEDDEAPAPQRRDKGKGRALPSSDADPGVLDLADSSDVELDVDGPLTSTHRGRKQVRRRSTLVLSASPSRAASPSSPPSPLTHLLSILPTCLPSHASSILHSAECAGSVEAAVEVLLARGYPDVGDEERERSERERKEAERDWADGETRKREGGDRGALYKRMALDQLYTDFPLLPAALIRKTFTAPPSFSLFAPAYLSLYASSRAGAHAAVQLKKARRPPAPVVRPVERVGFGEDGKEETWVEEVEEEAPEELRREMQWVRDKLVRERRATRAAAAEQAAQEKEHARVERLNERAREKGEAVECGCCFDEVAAVNTAACDDGHIFCKSCCARNASEQLGKRQATLPCMTTCTASFSPRSWATFLDAKTIEGLERLKQEGEVQMAFEGIEGFETCPFCPYACYIDNPDERLFRCERPECSKVSCRKCRKEGHVPLTCEEADKESRAAGVHAVAEAMSAALIRNCPKCKTPTAKIDGCNHMICSQCQTHWCYVCRAAIKGYDHFNDRGGTGACPTFDDTEMRNHEEVEKARLAAESNLDALTREDAAKLAGEKPVRNAPRRPLGHLPPGVALDDPWADLDGFRALAGEIAAQARAQAMAGRQAAAQQAAAAQQYAEAQQQAAQQQQTAAQAAAWGYVAYPQPPAAPAPYHADYAPQAAPMVYHPPPQPMYAHPWPPAVYGAPVHGGQQLVGGQGGAMQGVWEAPEDRRARAAEAAARRVAGW